MVRCRVPNMGGHPSKNGLSWISRKQNKWMSAERKGPPKFIKGKCMFELGFGEVGKLLGLK